jgi:hypothetical protein
MLKGLAKKRNEESKTSFLQLTCQLKDKEGQMDPFVCLDSCKGQILKTNC